MDRRGRRPCRSSTCARPTSARPATSRAPATSSSPSSHRGGQRRPRAAGRLLLPRRLALGDGRAGVSRLRLRGLLDERRAAALGAGGARAVARGRPRRRALAARRRGVGGLRAVSAPRLGLQPCCFRSLYNHRRTGFPTAASSQTTGGDQRYGGFERVPEREHRRGLRGRRISTTSATAPGFRKVRKGLGVTASA